MGNCMMPSALAKNSSDRKKNIVAFNMQYKQDREQLGEGRAGHVFKCTERSTSMAFACKNISKATQSAIECRREIMILNKLKGAPYIIQLNDVFEDARALYLVMSLCSGGELYDQIVAKSQTPYGRFGESDARTLMRQILGAVQACHDTHQITHRDLKPENFLLVRPDDIEEIRMIDFGLSRFYTEGERLRTRVGTVYYTAPEVWSENYDASCDLWSAGVMLYVLLCSYPPFDGDTDKEILRAVCRGKYGFPSPEWDTVSPAAKALIRRLVAKNPKRRPSAKEALQDGWFKEDHKLPPAVVAQAAQADGYKGLKGEEDAKDGGESGGEGEGQRRGLTASTSSEGLLAELAAAAVVTDLDDDDGGGGGGGGVDLDDDDDDEDGPNGGAPSSSSSSSSVAMAYAASSSAPPSSLADLDAELSLAHAAVTEQAPASEGGEDSGDFVGADIRGAASTSSASQSSAQPQPAAAAAAAAAAVSPELTAAQQERAAAVREFKAERERRKEAEGRSGGEQGGKEEATPRPAAAEGTESGYGALPSPANRQRKPSARRWESHSSGGGQKRTALPPPTPQKDEQSAPPPPMSEGDDDGWEAS